MRASTFYQCSVFFSKPLPHQDTMFVTRADGSKIAWTVEKGPAGEEQIFSFSEAIQQSIKEITFHKKVFKTIEHINNMDTIRTLPPPWRKN